MNKGEKKLKLQLAHAFGSSCSANLQNSLGITQEDGAYNLIYPVGKYVAVKSTERLDMSFIKLTEHLEQIQSMCVSPNKKLVALSEKYYDHTLKPGQERKPTLCVYKIQFVTGMKFLNTEKKSLVFTESKGDRFTQMKFSDDSRFLFLQTSDNKLVYVDVTSSSQNKQIKEIASGFDLKKQATQLSFNPKDQHQVYASGDGFFLGFNIKEGQFFPIDAPIKRLNYNQNFINHCWVDESRIALANDYQDVYIIDKVNNEVKLEIQDAFQLNGQINPNYNITSMIGFSRGLILGAKNGYFSIWIKNDDNKNNIPEDEFYQLIHLTTFKSERKNQVCGMDISNDEILAIQFENSDIATLELNKILPQLAEPIQQFKDMSKKLKKKIYFDYIYDGFHSGPISSLDICYQRPLIVTVSRQDSTIRIWNYKNFKCEQARRFLIDEKVSTIDEKYPLICAGIHPDGYMLAVGFVDKLRIFHILNNELRTYKEISVKQVSVIQYSQGGQYLAVSYPKPKSQYYQTIIYNSYTLEIVRVLKTHTKAVTSIHWENNDQSVATCGLDGNIFKYSDYIYSADKTEFGHQAKLQTLIFNEKTETWMAAGYDDKIQKGVLCESSIKDGEQRNERHILNGTYGGYQINTFQYCRTYHNYTGIIAGNNDGYITTYNHIFTPYFQDRIAAHDKPVSFLRISPDGLHCMTAGQDGNVFIFNIQEINEEGNVLSIKGSEKDDQNINPRAGVVDPGLADVVLVSKDEIEKYLAEQKKLQNDLEDLGNKMEYQTQEEKKEMESRIAEVKEKCQLEIRQAHERYEELKRQKTIIEKESANLRKGMENNHLKGVEELENLYEKKLAYENDKYLKLEQELLEERMKFDKKLKSIENKHDSAVNELKAEFNDNFHKAETMYETTKATAKELNQHYQEKLDQQEEEHEMEIRELNDRQATQIAELQDKIADLLSKNDMFKREEKTIEENMTKMKQKMKETEEHKDRLIQALSDANNQIEILKQDKKNYEEQLVKKEKKIHEYKYKINDLQKQKHVLSFRATEMRKSLEPKEAKIDKLKDELFKLEGEFEQMLKNNQKQKEEMDKMKNQIETLQKSLKVQIGLTNQKDSLLNKIIMQIHDCVKETDIKQWNQVMQTLYDQFVINANIKKSNHDQQGVDEMSRHIKLLENRINQMNNSSQKIVTRKEQDIHKKLKENAELIYDLNELRKQKREEQKQHQDQIDRLKEKNEIDRKKLEDELELYKKRAYNNNYGSKLNSNMMSRTQQNFDTRNPNRPQSMRQGNKKAGKVVFGSLFDSKTLGQFDRAKISDLMAEKELDQEKQAELQLKNLRLKIRSHKQQFNCHDQILDEEILYLQEQELTSRGMGGGYFQNQIDTRPQTGGGFQQNRF
ncbi:WD40-repeat-containing domain [Pseudocohnilembus persalinus]|uniref:WD40-repeat-containing domain n=1 Tax=Pseudocohnilembus persalinus TaxID=266149 RepID=A0A0V0QBY9_PSEPJ|nr:WD40-repeat-containing domain [Pseudocohnilembus persalinus]|eukprot:KRW99737.1 WD40-repeat-containing domain [Pseudocohnilembus persalinus]